MTYDSSLSWTCSARHSITNPCSLWSLYDNICTDYVAGWVYSIHQIFDDYWNESQIIVEVLEIMANITWAVFSKIPNFEINAELLEKHATLITNMTGDQEDKQPSKTEIEKAKNMTIWVWKSLLQVGPEQSKMSALYLMPLQGRPDKRTLMDSVDEIFRGLNIRKISAFFLTTTKMWDERMEEYFEDVHMLIVKEVVQGVLEKGRASEVMETVGSHFSWIWFDHQHFYHHGWMPLLSPSVITTTIEMFNGIGEGITEVCIRIDSGRS